MLEVGAQIIAERLHRGIPLLRFLAHGLRQNELQILGQALAGQQLGKDGAKRIDIGRRCLWFAAKLLGARVLGCEQPLHGARFFRVVDDFCDTEIEKLRLTCGVDQDIGGFQIAMNDEISMRIRHCFANLEKQPEDFARIQSGNVPVHTSSIHILHHQVWLPCGVARVEEPRNS